jgi:hypothetical protein
VEAVEQALIITVMVEEMEVLAEVARGVPMELVATLLLAELAGLEV